MIDADVGNIIVTKLQTMKEDIEWFNQKIPRQKADINIINDTFFHAKQYLEPESVDIVITSPPYLNNYHYIRNTRPQMYWLGYAEKPSDLHPLEHLNYGTYWQTARDALQIDLEFDLPSSDIANCLNHLRSLRPDKGIYGGKGWANYATAYFNDTLHFMENLVYVLKPGSRAIIVIGNSIIQGVFIPTDKYMGQIASLVGLELIDIDIPREKRVGDSIIRSDVRVEAARKTP